MSAILGPIAPYSNVPIEDQFYQPSRFVISAITLGSTTTVTTAEDHNYVIGQNIRLIIPADYGSYQLNEAEGMVISVPAADQVEILINSNNANAFISSPYTATITNATQANPCVLTASNSFKTNQRIEITDVGGMEELNDNSFIITACTSTTITLNVNSTAYTAYSGGGIATLVNHPSSQPQILAIGDFNSGQINSSGRVQNSTYILGSFINISPE